MNGFLPRLADAFARATARWVPDSFSIACLLTLLTAALAMALAGASPADCVRAWGEGVWGLLEFSMQMVVVVFAGYVVAVAPLTTRLLDRLAALPRSPRQAVAWTAFLSMALCWLNWGAGLIASAVLVRFVARRHPAVDYRLLVAVAYLGLGATWHAGPSGSAPLLLATPDSFMIRDGLIPAPVPVSATIFTAANLGFMAVVMVGLPVFAMLLHPPPERVVPAASVAVDALGGFDPPEKPAVRTPAALVMFNPVLHRILGGTGVLYLGGQLVAGAFALTLDTVNLLFLCLGLLLHPTPASLLKAAEDAARPLHGIVLQFPLYAGILGIVRGTALVDVAAAAFLAVASTRTFPLIVFWFSALLNYFVPSGGGQWAIQAPYVLRAGDSLGVPVPATVMAFAYGDMATNLIQPFWAIPLLAVARLEFRDVVGYEILMFAVFASLASAVLLLA